MRKLRLGLGSEGSHYRGLKVFEASKFHVGIGRKEKQLIFYFFVFFYSFQFSGGRFPEEILSYTKIMGLN